MNFIKQGGVFLCAGIFDFHSYIDNVDTEQKYEPYLRRHVYP